MREGKVYSLLSDLTTRAVSTTASRALATGDSALLICYVISIIQFGANKIHTIVTTANIASVCQEFGGNSNSFCNYSTYWH
jgi:hypothetical protein